MIRHKLIHWQLIKRAEHEKVDEPPNYKAIVMKIDPPGYFESIVNQEINPQLNKNWAKDLHDKSVAPEIDEVITR